MLFRCGPLAWQKNAPMVAPLVLALYNPGTAARRVSHR
jgi:hypothetical protein